MPTINPRNDVVYNINPPLVGTVLHLPYSVTLNPWIDPQGFKWYCPNGSSFGQSLSSALLKDDDFRFLYFALWSNAEVTVAGGKGASPEADWQAKKVMTPPDMRGRSPVMQGKGTGLTQRNLLSRWGSEQEILTIPQIPIHDHPRNPQGKGESARTYDAGGQIQWIVQPNLFKEIGVVITGQTGGGQPHNNCPPSKAYVELWALGV
ncbi:MAG: hypothetical protein ACFE0J_21520 [Elainellaceae cyanobacterium]